MQTKLEKNMPVYATRSEKKQELLEKAWCRTLSRTPKLPKKYILIHELKN